MPFKLLEVDTATDFEEVIECQWAAYQNPFQSFFRLFCPVHSDGPTAQAESLKECIACQLDWYNSDPTSYWGKVIDDNGKIVGACLWKICPTNLFENFFVMPSTLFDLKAFRFFATCSIHFCIIVDALGSLNN
ncbi:hypothetical protein BGZ61DRAFT_482505 [Ilyonectria robusta]|uniref:uncharacterized protein n=1 Tax=Ilyonectria robusta TaxID=1079257 RepID=UPI001E8E7BC0|nr:uncharacterized protein BGZ61DRAFT_482505 [Ilyonectria robusta]KAH8672156.1 hypothetical protein BGZ61DRAFT_482505 [Ilyonectria robusta]